MEGKLDDRKRQSDNLRNTVRKGFFHAQDERKKIYIILERLCAKYNVDISDIGGPEELELDIEEGEN